MVLQLSFHLLMSLTSTIGAAKPSKQGLTIRSKGSILLTIPLRPLTFRLKTVELNLFYGRDWINVTDFLPSPVPDLEEIGVQITSPVVAGPPDLIPGLLPQHGQLVIAGQTDVGKSLVALEICSALTTEQPLWGSLKPTRRANRILYILGEHYNEVIQRLWAITKLPMSDNVWLLGPEQISYDKWLVAGGRPNLQAIGKFKKWADGADLIVFDPFAAFVSGVDVENDNVQMRLVLDTMSLIAQSTGASCLVLAHQGKPMMDKFGQEHSRKSYAIRGASAIEDAATNIFYMDRFSKQESQAGAKISENIKLFSMIRRKYKGDAPAEYTLMRDAQTLTHSILGARPQSEAFKSDTLSKIVRLQNTYPEMSFGDATKMVATVQGIDERTVRRYIEEG